MTCFFIFLINAQAQIEKWIAKIRLIDWNGCMEISLKISLDAECGVVDLVMFFVYPSLFEVFRSSFPKLSECSKYHKASITQPSCGFYVWVMFDFCSNILDNQSYHCDWFFPMDNFQWCGIYTLLINQEKFLTYFYGWKTGHQSNSWDFFGHFNQSTNFDIFFYFLIDVYAQIGKSITNQDWSLEMLE